MRDRATARAMSPSKRRYLLGGLATACGLAVLLVVLIDGGAATTAAHDQRVTNRYLATRRTLLTHFEQSRRRRSRSVEMYVARIISTCAGALSHAPERHEGPRYLRKGSTIVLQPRAILLSDATSGAVLAMRATDATAIGEFSRTAKGLRWTDAALTNLVHALAETEELQVALTAPDLCHDARTWAASGYRSIQPQTGGTAEHLAATEQVLTNDLVRQGCVGPYPGPALLHVLERTMSPTQQAMAQRVSRSEAAVAAHGAELVRNAVARIEGALGTSLQAARAKTRSRRIVSPCIAVPRIGQP